MAEETQNWNILEVVENILCFLPGRYVATAAHVCRLWRDAVKEIRKSRRGCVVYLSPDNFGFDDISRDTVDFISQQHIEARALLLFLGASPSSSTGRIESFLQPIRKFLPQGCLFIGCTGHGVVGSGMSSSRNQSENSQGVSLMMFPRCEQLEIHDFYMPLPNKYEDMSVVKSFLPDMTLPVKLVIVLARPLSSGKLTRLTLALRSKYGDSVVVVGAFSGNPFSYNSEVRYREIVGLVFAGNLQATSTVITGGTKQESLQNLHDSVQRLVNSNIPKKNSFSLMFSCFSRGSTTYGYENAEYLTLKDALPGTAVAGLMAQQHLAFGCDTEKLKLRGIKPGGQDFLHVDASVLCLGSFALS
ncbi:F-box only protein 22-like [Acropora muricata]|uniref:F-box only protein 22-like n=1 Tax=Acropora muricata TaxID=159855 RepID=UPI0034E5D722